MSDTSPYDSSCPMASKTAPSSRLIRIVAPIIMALCFAGMPTCLYFAAQVEQVGIHILLVFASIGLLACFCISLKLIIDPYFDKKQDWRNSGEEILLGRLEGGLSSQVPGQPRRAWC